MKAKNWIRLATFVVFASSLYVFLAPKIEHGRHVKRAEARLASYTKADWASFYGEAVTLIDKTPTLGSTGDIRPVEWPSRMKELEPYYVSVRGQELFMGWTNGFDEEALFLIVHTQKPGGGNVPESTLGIEIIGSSQLPKKPYTPF